MSDTGPSLLEARVRLGLSRERVAALLDPPISSKTLERWEKERTPAPGWRRQQLAALFRQFNGTQDAA